MKLIIQKALVAVALLSVAPGVAQAQFSVYKDGDVVVNMASTVPDSVTFYLPKTVQRPDISLVGGSVPKMSEAVDLGLSVKWAPWNVGARDATAYGEYFAWGEITPKKDEKGNYGSYDWDSYRLGDKIGNDKIMYKYNKADGKEFLDPSDDAATANWGGKWRMPTEKEFTDLFEKCEWTWTVNYKNSGNNGYVIKSKSDDYKDAELFLPAAGDIEYTRLQGQGARTIYWLSELFLGNYSWAGCPAFDKRTNVPSNAGDRYSGFPVRAVCPK